MENVGICDQRPSMNICSYLPSKRLSICVGLGKRRSSHWQADIRSNYNAFLLAGHFVATFRDTAEKEIELDLVRPRLQSVSC